jgi:hypothetical protein
MQTLKYSKLYFLETFKMIFESNGKEKKKKNTEK